MYPLFTYVCIYIYISSSRNFVRRNCITRSNDYCDLNVDPSARLSLSFAFVQHLERVTISFRRSCDQSALVIGGLSPHHRRRLFLLPSWTCTLFQRDGPPLYTKLRLVPKFTDSWHEMVKLYLSSPPYIPSFALDKARHSGSDVLRPLKMNRSCQESF